MSRKSGFPQQENTFFGYLFEALRDQMVSKRHSKSVGDLREEEALQHKQLYTKKMPKNVVQRHAAHRKNHENKPKTL